MTKICQIFVKMAEYSVNNEYSARKQIFVRTRTFGWFWNTNIRLRTKVKFPFSFGHWECSDKETFLLHGPIFPIYYYASLPAMPQASKHWAHKKLFLRLFLKSEFQTAASINRGSASEPAEAEKCHTFGSLLRYTQIKIYIHTRSSKRCAE